MKKVSIFIEDNDGEVKVGVITFNNGNEFSGHIPYIQKPNHFNAEFLFEEGEDNTDENEVMESLKYTLDENNTPYEIIDVNSDGELIYVQFSLDGYEVDLDDMDEVSE